MTPGEPESDRPRGDVRALLLSFSEAPVARLGIGLVAGILAFWVLRDVLPAFALVVLMIAIATVAAPGVPSAVAAAGRAMVQGLREQSRDAFFLTTQWLRGQSLSVRIVREAALAGGLLTLYRFGRGLVSGAEDAARQNALWIMEVEHRLGIFVEEAWQDFFLDRSGWMWFFNEYYTWMHFPTTGLLLFWAFMWRRENYRLIRNTLAIATVISFFVHWLWPLMPPRMFGSLGFEDTVAEGIYSERELGPFTNQLAAMPSLHFGWSLLVGIAPFVLIKHWTRWIYLAHPVITLVCIVVTANHYFLDAVFVVPIMWGAYKVAGSPWLNGFLDRFWGRPTGLPSAAAVALISGSEPASSTSKSDEPADR